MHALGAPRKFRLAPLPDWLVKYEYSNRSQTLMSEPESLRSRL